jgi:phospholipase C
MIVISPYARPGFVSHTYTDHVSILKFIERNWRLRPLSARSLDNLPNPRSRRRNPYVPINRPSIGDMFDYFDFIHPMATVASVPASTAPLRTSHRPELVTNSMR